MWRDDGWTEPRDVRRPEAFRAGTDCYCRVQKRKIVPVDKRKCRDRGTFARRNIADQCCPENAVAIGKVKTPIACSAVARQNAGRRRTAPEPAGVWLKVCWFEATGMIDPGVMFHYEFAVADSGVPARR